MFNHALSEEINNYQSTVITINKNLITSFMDSIKQTTLLLVSDEPIGEYLSEKIDDPLKRITTRQKIEKQFTHFLTSQITSSNNYYRNTLFLNNTIPISSSFPSATLDSNNTTRMSNVYIDTEIKDSDWYKNTLSSPRNYYVFINESTKEFCYAKKIKNTYYTGPYDPDGIGVLVIGIHLDQLEKVLSFSPITPNSSFVLFNQTNNVLYKSNSSISSKLFLQLNKKNADQKQTSYNSNNRIITMDGKKYVTSVTKIDWGLSLVFLTPYSDIQEQIAYRMNIFVAFSIFIMILISALAYVISKKTTEPIINLSKVIKLVDDTRNFDLNSLKVSNDKEIIVLCHSFEELILKVNSLIDDIQLENEKQKASELRALQAQINPHFIFNAMDVVNWIALSKNEDEIANIVGSISNLMRYSITEPDQMVQIEQEIGNIREFISIHQLRHNNKIQLKVTSEISLSYIYIPKFTLQPLVENSITHGIEDPNICLEIHIDIRYENPILIIEVSDNGKGCNPEKLNDYLSYMPTNLVVSNGFGVRNLNERILLNFRENSGLSYGVNEQGCLVAKIQMDFSSYRKKKSTHEDLFLSANVE
jgi:sensor histidine kinase YesM